MRDTILKEGGIEAAKILLDSSESKLQKYGCFVLVCITQHSFDGERGNSYDCCLALDKTKVLNSLVELIKNTSEEKSKSWGTSCLGNCAYISKNIFFFFLFLFLLFFVLFFVLFFIFYFYFFIFFN